MYAGEIIQRRALSLLLFCTTFAVVGGDGRQLGAALIEPYGFSGANGVFTVSGSGPADGGLPNGDNFDNRHFFGPGAVLTANPFSPTASTSFTLGNVTASADAKASLGQIGVRSMMNTDTQSAVPFPAGFADAGWIDTVLLSIPGQTGQIATVTFGLQVTGTLFAQGPNVVSLLQLIVASELGANTVFETPFYQIQADGSGPVSQSVSDTLLVSLPFVVGTPTPIEVRAQSRAMTSSQTSFGINSSIVDFFSTVTWGGIESVSVGGIPFSDFTAIGVESGIDWAEPVAGKIVPEPTGLVVWLMLVGVGVTFAWRHFGRR